MNTKRDVLYRVEDKFCCSQEELYSIQRRLDCVLKSDSNENSLDGYSISSLYFDNLRDSYLSDTVDGNNIRRKYRIRIYNNSFDLIKLEVKEKVNNRINKLTRTITIEDMQKLMRGECIEKETTLSDPIFLFNLAIQTEGLRPKVIVTYERKAFVFEPGNVRITFDRNIRCSDRCFDFGKHNIVYDFLRENDSVLEVKYDEFMPQFLLQLLEVGNMQQTAYSKYQLCRERYQ